jgi:outer membrane protein OmpA-like peptidoglycan-associated protein
MKRIYKRATSYNVFLIKSLVVLFFIGTGFNMYASAGKEEQNTRKYSKLSVGKKYKLAKTLMGKGGYITAAQYLEEVVTKKPKKHQALYMAAKANEAIRDYVRAEKFYSQLLEVKPGKYPMARYDYARMLKYNGKYDAAKKEFASFKDEYDGNDAEVLQKLVKNEIAGCDYALTTGKNPIAPRKVEHVSEPVNNELTELAPKWIDSKTLLYSKFPHDTAINLTNFWKMKKDYRTKIFTATGEGANFNNETLVPGAVNDPKFHCGNAVTTADGNTMYFTKCSEDKMLNMICKIYMSKKEGSTWGEPKEMPINIEDYTSTRPALGKDANGKDILYFSSTRPGGQGGEDIWFATIDNNGVASNPKNLGKLINTAGDETTPFYDMAFRRLFFSSNGHPNMGGYDVFVAKGNVDGWDSIQNMGNPVNSSADDLYLALDANGEQGYMVSNRIGSIATRGTTSGDDIYTVYLGGRKVFLRGYYAVKGDATKKPIAGVDNSFYLNSDGTFDKKSASVTAGTQKFVYAMEPGKKYKINGTKEGFYPAVDNIESPAKINSMSDTIDMVFYMEPIIKLKAKIENVYFVFDRHGLNKENSMGKTDSVASFLINNPAYGLEINGHTDSKGTDEYNDKLSMERAQEVANYLITKKGIAKERLVVKGIGEKQPIAPNEFPDGRDNEEGRAANRRVEFKLFSAEDKILIEYDKAFPTTVE